MITRPSAAMLVVLVLLAVVGQASGFIVAKRRYHGPSSGTRQPNRAAQAGDGIDSEARLVPSQDHLTLSREAPYSFKRFGARKLPLWGAVNPALPARSDRGDDVAETVVQPRPGMETQLGGWSYARTVLTNRGKAKDGAGGQGAASGSSSAGSASGAAQSAGSSGDGGRGSSDGVTGGDGSGGAGDPEGKGDGGDKKGQGGDDDDDDDEEDDEDRGKENKEGRDDGLDSWELSEFGDSQDGVGISFSSEERESAGAGAGVAVGSAATAESDKGLEGGAPQQEYEVVCDGDVCERKPVGSGSAPLAQTVAGASAAVDAADAALAAADAAALGDAAEPEGQEGGAAVVDGGGDDVDSSHGAEDAGDAEDAPTAAAVATAGADAVGGSGAGGAGGAGLPEGGGEGDGDDDAPSPADNPDVAQLVSMGWELEESAAALAQSGGDLTKAAEALAAQEEADLERYEEGLADLQQRGWDSDVAMSAMREAGGNSTAALLALEEEDKMLSVQFEQSIEEMVEHGWDEEVARKALLMQWQKDIEGGGGSRKAQKQFEKTVKGVHEKGVKEGKAASPSGGGGGSSKKKNEPPAPTPAKREDVVFEVTDKTLQKVVLESPVPVILDVYAEWCGPCKQLTPALEEAAIRSGGMFRVAKVDAEKQKGIAEVLGIKAFPSVFGVKDGIILDNFVGGLPQDEMQAFMMGVVMGIPPPKDKELREHQKGQSELRGISRKLAHVAGLAVLGSRKKESLCIKVDKALSAMLPTNDGSPPASEDAAAVAAAKKAARTVITVLMSAYKFPEDPKYRSLSTTSKVYEEVLAPHPPMLEALRLAGFRHKDGDESHLTLLHRNMAVLASVQDRVEVWNKSVKMPEVVDEDSEDEYDSDEEDEEQIERLRQARAHLAKVAKLEITDSSGNHETAVKMEMGADCTVGELFQVLQEDEGFGEDLVLTTAFPKRELAASDPACRSSTLRSLGLTPSARLTATTAAALAAAAEKEADGDDAEAAATRKAGLKAKMMDKSRDGSRKGSKKAGSLFGASDGIIEVKKGKHQEYFGGDSTVTLAAEDTEEDAEDEGEADASAGEDDFGQSGEGYVSTYSEEGPSSSSDERGRRAPELAASAAAAAAAASRERGGDGTRFVQQFEDSDAESESERGTSATEVPASEDPSSDGEYSMESSGDGDGDGYDAAGSAEEGRVSYDVENGEEYDDEDEEEDEEEGSLSYDDSYSGEQEEEEEEEVGRPMSGGKQVRGRQRGAEGEGGSSYDEDESYDDVDSYYDESFSSEEQEARGSSRGSLGRPRV